MEFTLTQDFPAGLDCLWAAFGRADYPRLKYLALGATATIVESGPESTRMLLTWRVESRVPVIGGKVERLFADQVRNALEADHAFTLQYLVAIASKHPRTLSSPRDAARRGPRSRS